MPGDLPAQPAQDDLLTAYSAGYSHADITAAIGSEPPRPDIGEIWSGTHPADATWSDPTKLDTPEQASGLIHQMAESGLGIGAVEGVGLRAAALGVKTTATELTPAMSKIDLAVESLDQAMGTIPAKIAKWTAATVGADLAGGPHRLGAHSSVKD